MNPPINVPLILLSICAACLPLKAQTQTQTQPGGLQWIPRALVEYRYDDNIFVQPDNKQGAGILETHTGLGLSRFGPRLNLHAAYDFGLLRYSKHPGIFDDVHHDAFTGLSYEMAHSGTIDVQNRYRDTSAPPTSELAQPAKRKENRAQAQAVVYAGSRLFAALHAGAILVDYDTRILGDVLDRSEIMVGPDFGWRLSPRLRAFLGYRHTRISYESATSKDNATHEVLLGARGEFTARLTGKAQAGLLSRTYETEEVGRAKSQTTPGADISLAWQAPAQVVIDLGASRHFEESASNRYYRANAVWLSLRKAVLYRITAQLNARYGFDSYPTQVTSSGSIEDRRDDLVQAGFRLTYQFPEIFQIHAGYLFRQRTSNSTINDFRNNVVAAGIGMAFT